MKYPSEYIQFLVHFHSDRDYFECHEILEAYWKKHDFKHNSIWVGFIQVAVSFYHYRRQNNSGALKTIEKAIRIVEEHSILLNKFGLSSEFPLQLRQIKMDIHTGKPYKSYFFPIIHPELLKQCKQESIRLQLNWGSESNLEDTELVHRHALRDRNEIINLRNEKLIK